MTSLPLFIEAAVESIGGAVAADAEGVDRIELCGSLHDGGVTADNVGLAAAGTPTPAAPQEAPPSAPAPAPAPAPDSLPPPP